jgi:Tol biopolymer transport system component
MPTVHSQPPPARARVGAPPTLAMLATALLALELAGVALGQQGALSARRHLRRTDTPPPPAVLTYTSIRQNAYWDISTMDVATGAVQRITRQTFNIMACAWSPDGSRLLFLTDRDGNLEIYSMAADGSDWHRITDTPGFDYGPEWSPDGRRIAYAEDTGSGTLQVFLADPDGSNRVQLTSGPAGAYGPMWSRDGKRLSYIGGRNVMVMGSDGSSPVTLYSGNAELQNSDWSPDGRCLMFMSKQTGIFKLHRIRLSDGAVEPVPTGDYDAWDGQWSPDGSLISFYSYGVGSQGFHSGMFAVFLMNADGSNLRQVTTLSATDRSWHPIWGP